MKNSYKLFDTFWDSTAIPVTKPQIELMDKYEELNNHVMLSEILKKGFIDECSMHVEPFTIILDYVPKTESACVRKYYTKRLLQILHQMDNGVCVCEDKLIADSLNAEIDSYYN